MIERSKRQTNVTMITRELGGRDDGKKWFTRVPPEVKRIHGAIYYTALLT